MGIFDTLEDLEHVVDALAEIGVNPSHLVLVIGDTGPYALSGMLLRHEGGSRIAEIRLQRRKGKALQVGRTGPSSFAEPGLLLAPFETWGPAKTTQKLNALLEHGACALVVLMDRPEDEPAVLKILLANSIDQVQQHDVIAAG